MSMPKMPSRPAMSRMATSGGLSALPQASSTPSLRGQEQLLDGKHRNDDGAANARHLGVGNPGVVVAVEQTVVVGIEPEAGGKLPRKNRRVRARVDEEIAGGRKVAVLAANRGEGNVGPDRDRSARLNRVGIELWRSPQIHRVAVGSADGLGLGKNGVHVAKIEQIVRARPRAACRES